MPVLPPFDEHGLLPAGDYELTLEELEQSHLVIGSQSEGDAVVRKDAPWFCKKLWMCL